LGKKNGYRAIVRRIETQRVLEAKKRVEKIRPHTRVGKGLPLQRVKKGGTQILNVRDATSPCLVKKKKGEK